MYREDALDADYGSYMYHLPRLPTGMPASEGAAVAGGRWEVNTGSPNHLGTKFTLELQCKCTIHPQSGENFRC